MHVLILSPGRDETAENDARALVDSGMRVGLACLDAADLKYLNPLSFWWRRFQSVEVDEPPRHFSILRSLGWNTFPGTALGGSFTTRVMEGLIDEYTARHGSPELIHAHDALGAGLAALQASRRMGIPFVVTEPAHALRNGHLNANQRRTLATVYGAAAAVVSSEIVPPAIDTEYYTPLREPRAETFTIVAAGEHADDDKLRTLLGAVALLRARGHAPRLVVVCRLAAQERVLEFASVAGISDDLQLADPLARWHVREWLRDATVAIAPCRQHACNRFLLEAAACGVPALAPSGLELQDAASLAEAITAIRGKRPDRDELRVAARRFAYPVVAGILRGIYARALAKPAPPPVPSPRAGGGRAAWGEG